MYEERLAEFSRERLDGRPIPNDLRTMLVAQWEGRTDFQYLLDITFFADQLAALGLPLSTRDYDALYDDDYAVDPEKLTDELIDAEREKRGIRTARTSSGPAL